MAVDIDIWRTAHFYLKRYGDHAEQEAIGRAGAMLMDGDETAALMWRKVARAIEELKRAKNHASYN